MKKFAKDPLLLDDLDPARVSHISLKDHAPCQNCDHKPCTYICPSEVYRWEMTQAKLLIDYRRCLECGACLLVCPQENIQWRYPPGGRGITYHYS